MATLSSLLLAARAPGPCRTLDPVALADWVEATEARIAAKVPLDERQLQRIINEQQTGGFTSGDGETQDARRGKAGAGEESWRLGRQLEHGARVEPHRAAEPPLFDADARRRAIAMRRAGASYADIGRTFRHYRGVPARRGLEQLVHRALRG